jgi:transposase InsO family protein
VPGRPPFRPEEAGPVGQTVSPSTGRRYGLARVCRLWDLPRSTVYFQRHQRIIPVEQRTEPKRRGPLGPCSDEELVAHIRRVLTESPFHGEGYRKVWARLRYQGIRTSKERVRRLMREHGLQASQLVGHPHGPKAHDGTIITERPDEMWGTDMTTTVTTGEGQVCVFVAVDHCTSECIGIHAAKSGNRFEALEPIRQGVREHFGGFERGIAEGLAIRHDHGSAYMSDDFRQELAFLGMTSSPNFAREPEGNGVAERFIRTLKENLLWVRSFATVAELIEALREFRRRYNEQWLIERHGFRTPSQVRFDLSGTSKDLNAGPPCRRVG